MKEIKEVKVYLPYRNYTRLLCVIFITLKLIGIINWKWGWVLSPVWIECSLLILWGIIQGLAEGKK